MPLSAQKAQRAHVAVEDVDGLQPAVETVQLHLCDVAVLLLVQAWPVPEDEHLLVSNVDGSCIFGSSSPAKCRETSRYARNSQTLARSLFSGSGCCGAGPAVGQHDDERAVLRNEARKHGLAWESCCASGSTKGAPVRTSSRFFCSHVLLTRHVAECSPPFTHNLKSSSKSANVSSSSAAASRWCSRHW